MTRSLHDAPQGAHEATVPGPRAPARPEPRGPEVQPLLQAVGIEKAYRRGLWPARRSTQVLRGVDLTLSSGEVVGLVRENGSGKSTLMKILVGAMGGGVVDIPNSAVSISIPLSIFDRNLLPEGADGGRELVAE